MRKITAGLFITLDGVVEAPEKWNPPYYDDELGQAVMPQLMDADLHLQEGLLDELRLLMHPIVVGTGRHLFEGGRIEVPLNLLECRPHRNGVIALRYARAA